jgi:hypothetical protein
VDDGAADDRREEREPELLDRLRGENAVLLTVDDVRPAAGAALGEVFGFELEEIPADDGPGLWKQPIHAQLAR